MFRSYIIYLSYDCSTVFLSHYWNPFLPTHTDQTTSLNNLFTKHTFSLTCPFTDGYYSPVSWLPPPLQIHDFCSTPSGWVVRTGEAAHLFIGHQPGSHHHHILLAPHKIYSLSGWVVPLPLLLRHKTHTVCFSPKVESPWGTHLGLPILPRYLPSTPRSLGKDNPTNVFAFSHGRRIHTDFPSHFPVHSAGTLYPPTVSVGVVWAGSVQLADPLALTSQVASAKFASQCFHVPLPKTFNSLQHFSVFPGACWW